MSEERYAEDLKPGDVIHANGKEYVFQRIEKLPSPGRSGKIQTDKGVFFITVFRGVLRFRKRAEEET